MLVECVVNVSEGRDLAVLDALSAAAGSTLLDRHEDADHHRAVFTLVGSPDDVEDAARALAAETVARVDLRAHAGVHPRLGALDVVPFVPYALRSMPDLDLRDVVPLRDAFAHWLAADLGVPAFLYGPLPGTHERTLPEVRRTAFRGLDPDFGPRKPHVTAGASAVGARPVLIAYNVRVVARGPAVSALDVARAVATRVRGPGLRTLGLGVADHAQVSCNLVAPAVVGPEQAYDAVAAVVGAEGGQISGAELVGLLPSAVLAQIPTTRWLELGLSEEATVEARLDGQGRP